MAAATIGTKLSQWQTMPLDPLKQIITAVAIDEWNSVARTCRSFKVAVDRVTKDSYSQWCETFKTYGIPFPSMPIEMRCRIALIHSQAKITSNTFSTYLQLTSSCVALATDKHTESAEFVLCAKQRMSAAVRIAIEAAQEYEQSYSADELELMVGGTALGEGYFSGLREAIVEVAKQERDRIMVERLTAEFLKVTKTARAQLTMRVDLYTQLLRSMNDRLAEEFLKIESAAGTLRLHTDGYHQHRVAIASGDCTLFPLSHYVMRAVMLSREEALQWNVTFDELCKRETVLEALPHGTMLKCIKELKDRKDLWSHLRNTRGRPEFVKSALARIAPLLTPTEWDEAERIAQRRSQPEFLAVIKQYRENPSLGE